MNDRSYFCSMHDHQSSDVPMSLSVPRYSVSVIRIALRGALRSLASDGVEVKWPEDYQASVWLRTTGKPKQRKTPPKPNHEPGTPPVQLPGHHSGELSEMLFPGTDNYSQCPQDVHRWFVHNTHVAHERAAGMPGRRLKYAELSFRKIHEEDKQRPHIVC